MREIPLTQGKVALVDDGDYDLVSRFKWLAAKAPRTWYARRVDYGAGRKKNESMHRLILNAPPDKIVDHINGNGLDNRRENLRLATKIQNNCNTRLRRDNRSGYKGVKRNALRWIARIRIDRKLIHLGSFATKEDAARAYDNAARQHFGEFAKLNFPLE